jgi:NitT/TauT family transport system permease protein
MAIVQELSESKIQATPKRTRLQRIWEHMKVYSYPVGAALFALAVWEAVVFSFHVPHYILPAPFAIVREGIKGSSWIAPHYWITLYEAIVGLVAGILVAVPFALIIAYSPFLYRSFYPLMVFFDEVPKVAFAPILVTWFGFGLAPKMILTFIICLFPIFLNGVAGFQGISPELINLGRAAGAREWQMFWKIRLPNALPNLFVGLKIAASGAMVGAVVSEFLAAERGLGFFLQKALSMLNMELGFAIIVAMWTIGLAFFYGMTLLESRGIRWHVSKRARRRGALG